MDNAVDSRRSSSILRRFLRLHVSLRRLLTIAVVLACAATIIGFLGRLWWPFELAAHFRVQCFLFLSLAVVFYIAKRAYELVFITVVLALVNFITIVPLYLADCPCTPINRDFRAIVANLDLQNTAYNKAAQVISNRKPDFILATEVTQEWEHQLLTRLPSYRFVFGQARHDHFGIMILSKLPLRKTRLGYLGTAGIPFVMAELTVNGKPLFFVGMHPPPPVSSDAYTDRKLQVEKLAALVAKMQTEVVVMGDLNMTSWSPIFRDLIRVSGLKDTRRGFGIHATFPTHLPFFLIPIDHCLISGGLRTVSRSIGPYIGSDHYPVTVDLAFNDKQR